MCRGHKPIYTPTLRNDDFPQGTGSDQSEAGRNGKGASDKALTGLPQWR
jgi:hypothetical protein